MGLRIRVMNALVNGGIPAADVAQIAFEVLHVDGVEADDGLG